MSLKAQGINPKGLQKRVLLRPDCTEYRKHFYQLSSRRQCNQVGVQPIEMKEIQSSLDIRCIWDEYEREVFMEIIIEMDSVYTDHMHKKMQESNKAP